MLNFSCYCPTRIVLGKGVETEAGRLIAAAGCKRVLLHYGGASAKKSGLIGRVIASLGEHGLAVVEYGGVRPNTALSLVRDAIGVCRRESIDFILAVGGGSVIDSAKAVAAGTPAERDVWEYYCGKATVEKALPIGVVLTLPASGSESNPAGGVYNEDLNEKGGAYAEFLFPVFALINPETNYSLPPFQTACGCCDIFSHLMERYFTNTPEVALTDVLLEGVMRSVLANAATVMKNPEDYTARAELNYAGTLAPNPFIGSGREACFGVHHIERALGAAYDSIAHGAGIGMITPSWMRVVQVHDVRRFSRFSIKVMGVPADHPEVMDEGIRRYEAWLDCLGLPRRLSEVKVEKNALPTITAKAVERAGTVGHYVKLDAGSVARILEMAW